MLYDAGNTQLVLCDNLEGCDGVGGRFKREGTYVYLWLIHVDVWQNPTQYCKAIILQLKIKKRIKVKKEAMNLKKIFFNTTANVELSMFKEQWEER